MIKSLKKNDIRTTPFTAAKKWNPQNKLHKDLILWQSGSVSGSLSLTFKEYNDGTVAPYTYISSAIALQQQQDDFLRFREGVNLSGSISPTGSFYYDPVLSEKNVDGTYKTVLYATTKHLFYKESQDPSKIFGLESLDSSNVNRSLPNKISTFNIPQNKFGEKVIPKSVVITHEIQGQTYSVVDDGNSNLVVSDKTFINNQDANIDKVPANIILNGLPTNPHSEQYDGTPYVITATTKPLNLAYILTYNGSTTPPTNAGTYTVVATIDDNFYAASKTSTFIIEKFPLTINISNLNPTYDGNPKPVTVSPAVNVNYDVTYNGSTTPPTNAGAYNVVVTINDINYQGTQIATLNIVPQTPTITAQCPSKTYGDEDFTIPVNTVSDGAISYTINSGPATIVNGKIRITGVGTLNITITQAAAGNYSAASVNCSSITISAKPLTVIGITANDKVQDATTTATLNTGTKALQGVIINPNGTSDDVTLNGPTGGVFSDSLPGQGKTVTISGLTISGADVSFGKYTLVQPTTTATIKANSVSGIITMTGATVTYNGKPQPLGVSVTNNIPIKITYPNGRVDRLFQGDITNLSGNDYPTDIGKYEVTAELDVTIPNDTIIYTVTTVKATLEIKPIQGNITFGPDIFYYDRNPKPVIILSQSPVGEALTITYTGPIYGSNSVPPSATGTYDVNVKFKNPNIFYNNTVKLTIKAIPTNICGTNITNETVNQQYQKNIIDFSPSVNQTGKVNFNYSVGRGASQFTIEYPLNSGNIVYPSVPELRSKELRSKDIAVGTNIVDYVTGATVTVTGGGTPDNNIPFSFNKDKTLNTGQNNDKCLITVYTPTNNNSWTYSISCVGAPATVIPTATEIFLQDFRNVDKSVKNKYSGSNLQLFISWLGSQKQANNISSGEHNAIIRIINNSNALDFTDTRTSVLLDTDTNLKIIVNYFTDPNGLVVITLQYKRLKDSLNNTISNEFASDCHYYKYIGTLSSAFPADAITQLKSQINSDSFKNTIRMPARDTSNTYKEKSGEVQRSLLLQLVGDTNIMKNTIDKKIFKFTPFKNDKVVSNVVIYYEAQGTEYPISMPYGAPRFNDTNDYPSGYISIDAINKTVEIIYPADCQL